MSLAPGTRVGVYQVLSLLGAGGMGEVYRARDARLQRDIALKILPNHFASNPERLARFEREAQVFATLAHPNVGHIYGLERSGSTPVLVLEEFPRASLSSPPTNPRPFGHQMVISSFSAHDERESWICIKGHRMEVVLKMRSSSTTC